MVRVREPAACTGRPLATGRSPDCGLEPVGAAELEGQRIGADPCLRKGRPGTVPGDREERKKRPEAERARANHRLSNGIRARKSLARVRTGQRRHTGAAVLPG